jgi:hypothetical protein
VAKESRLWLHGFAGLGALVASIACGLQAISLNLYDFYHRGANLSGPSALAALASIMLFVAGVVAIAVDRRVPAIVCAAFTAPLWVCYVVMALRIAATARANRLPIGFLDFVPPILLFASTVATVLAAISPDDIHEKEIRGFQIVTDPGDES